MRFGAMASGISGHLAVITYSIGSTGPGGGIVFYDAGSVQSWGRYLEAAPTTGGSPWTNAGYNFSANTNTLVTTGTAIGTGYTNTLAMAGQSGAGVAASNAGIASQAYRGPNNKTDWFLPSLNELNQLYINRASVGTFEAYYYLSSSEFDANSAWVQDFRGNYQSSYPKNFSFYVRPIRYV